MIIPIHRYPDKSGGGHHTTTFIRNLIWIGITNKKAGCYFIKTKGHLNHEMAFDWFINYLQGLPLLLSQK